jgi:hypothetical protein
MIIKLGENFTIFASDVYSDDSALNDIEIQEKFAAAVAESKQIAPRAEDFLYFTAVMMHAAEHALLDDRGELRKDAFGNPISAKWERNGESVKWVCSDPSIKPFKNNNGDIFSEAELLKAYKKWVKKPLCLDHKSSSVDYTRGIIIDTYYDRKLKRVIALCALDKVNYPDLARKVSTGYATCVSMGTGVGKAICYDCGRVARTEKDFCNHMKSRSCYGEINEELNPIELSIVVNGADPKAKIKTIVAHTEALQEYITAKEKELASRTNVKVAEFITSLDAITEQAGNLKEEIKTLLAEKTEEQSVIAESDSVDLQKINAQLEQILQKINKLSNLQEVNSMSDKKAYFQGTEEPALGQVKYPKEDADSIRDKEDKQMQVKDMGPVDKLAPGDEEVKRKLQRMAEEIELARLRREAAVQFAKEFASKQAYFQGTEEPALGKVKYPKEDADSIRDKEDKQMQGQAPFPGVGDVNGLHPSPASVSEKDELKRKQMLSRASSKLTAHRVKAATSDGKDDLANSRWDIRKDNKVVFSATVAELSKGAVAELGTAILTEQFASDLLKRIAEQGVEKVSAMYKAAQAAPAMPAMPEMPALPAASEPAVEDKGGAGDLKDKLPELLDEVESTQSEVRKAVEALMGDSGNELKELDSLGETGGLSPTTAALLKMERKLATSLKQTFKEANKKLASVKEELELLQQVASVKTASSREVSAMGRDVMERSKALLAECYKLMDTFNKFAQGRDIVMKVASEQVKVAQEKDPFEGEVGKVYQKGDPLMPLDATPGVAYQPKPVAPAAKPAAPVAAKPAPVKEKLPSQKTLEELMRERGDRSGLESMLINVSRESPATFHQTPQATPPSGQEKADANDLKMNSDGSVEGNAKEVGEMMKAKAEFDLETKEGRAAFRAKIAADKEKMNSVMQAAHPKGGTNLKFDNKPGDLAKIETEEEKRQAILKVLNAPLKVRQAAENIQKVILAGEIDAANVDDLGAFGVDKDAIAYWKQYFGQAKDPASKEFAAELTSDHEAAKKAAEEEANHVKLSRAYELAYDMRDRGMITSKAAIKDQVEKLMKMNDVGFEHYAQTISRLPQVKTASALPKVGHFEETLIANAGKSESEESLVAQFADAFAGRRY